MDHDPTKSPDYLWECYGWAFQSALRTYINITLGNLPDFFELIQAQRLDYPGDYNRDFADNGEE